MRHGKKILKIGRTASHRKATLQSMSAALIEHKRITTTLGKARALRVFVEPILNRAKDDSTASRREAFRHLQSKEAVKELYGSIAGAIGSRPGGYTRIVKLGQRGGDASEMAVVEIVDFNDVKPTGSSSAKRKTRRSRVRSAGETAAPAAAAPAATPPAVAETVDETVEEAPDAVEETPAEEAAPADAIDETAVEGAPVQEAAAEASDAAATDADAGDDAQAGDAPPTQHRG